MRSNRHAESRQPEFSVTTCGRIDATSQDNIRIALKALGFHAEKGIGSLDIVLRRDGDELPLVLHVKSDMDSLWLEVERRFGFRPARKYFETVIGDLFRRGAL